MFNTKTNIIFDLDGTLWDSRGTVLNAWNTVLNKHGYSNITLRKLSKHTGLEQFQILMNILEIGKDEAVKLGKMLFNEEQKKLKKKGGSLYSNVKETLYELEKYCNLFIVSNCQDGYIEIFIDFFDFKGLFVDYESAGRTKQNKKENIKILMERNNISNAFYVGDTESDKNAAKSNKLPFIYAKYGFGNAKSYDYVICNFIELLNYSEFKINK